MNSLIAELKENDQDFEFYPTTAEIINRVCRDIKGEYRNRCNSILDIGAGNGKVLLDLQKNLDEYSQINDLYAIEKSEILRSSLPENVYIIGTDFYEQSLLDKQIDITFCNPPYSQYEQWAKKIIRESASNVVYLVIPTRWTDSEDIKQAIKYRDAKYKTIGEFSFINSEDRTARATVNLIKIELSTEKDDAFDRFFNSEFAELKKKFEEKEEPKGEEKESHFNSLVLGETYVQSLVDMYNAEIEHIRKNYELVGKLDCDLLKEFDVSPARILECLKARLKGLKNLYWNELMGRMSEVTSRLTTKKRKTLLDTIHENGHVDFTASNVYAVILWLLKNASKYIDEQLIETYEQALSQANVKNYKSNQKVFVGDRWRYNEEKPTHISLEYRLVLEHCGRIEKHWCNSDKCSLTENACETIKDFMTVAYNLGFSCNTTDTRLYHYNDQYPWKPGNPQIFTFHKDNDHGTLLEVKAHLNGNIHIRMNQKFALALNVEYGRLKGWLKTPAEAAEELDDSTAPEYFKVNNALLFNTALLMLPHKEETKTKTVKEIEPVQTSLF